MHMKESARAGCKALTRELTEAFNFLKGDNYKHKHFDGQQYT